jgi:hypothetical protein
VIIRLSRPLGYDDFILANLDVLGFYRINYDLENWNKIKQQLENNYAVTAILFCEILIQ